MSERLPGTRPVVLTDYWNEERTHRPYQNSVHDPNTDAPLDSYRLFDEAVREAGAVDGDEIEIVIRKTGRRPFGDRRYVYTKPHTYAREPAAPQPEGEPTK